MADKIVEIKLKRLHQRQEQIMSEAKRFNVLKCGRRFGKTTLIEELSSIALDGKSVGIWFPTYKDLADVWTSLKQIYFPILKTSSEQLKSILLTTGGKIDCWSLEDPDSGRGRAYHRAIIDEAEKASRLKDGWEQTIRATLIDYMGDAWFMSTPKFGDTYFKKIFNNEQTMDNWKSWRFTSFDNPFLDPLEIEEARNYGDLVFRCEYLAEDVDASFNPYAWAFNKEKHIVPEIKADFNKYLYISFDFNVDPCVCVIAHSDGLGSLDIIETIKLANSDIYKMCERIKITYPGFIYFLTGDVSGNKRDAAVRDNMTAWKIIQQELQLSNAQLVLPNQNPRLDENAILVNYVLLNGNIRIDKNKNAGLIYDLINATLLADGSIKKGNRNDPTQQLDCLDAARYLINTWHKKFINIKTV